MAQESYETGGQWLPSGMPWIDGDHHVPVPHINFHSLSRASKKRLLALLGNGCQRFVKSNLEPSLQNAWEPVTSTLAECQKISRHGGIAQYDSQHVLYYPSLVYRLNDRADTCFTLSHSLQKINNRWAIMGNEVGRGGLGRVADVLGWIDIEKGKLKVRYLSRKGLPSNSLVKTSKAVRKAVDSQEAFGKKIKESNEILKSYSDPQALVFLEGTQEKKRIGKEEGSKKYLEQEEFVVVKQLMNRVPGVTLEKICDDVEKNNVSWTDDEKLNLLIELGKTLQLFHKETGRAHLDVSSSNVMVNKTNGGIQVSLIDFDLSRPLDEVGRIEGTHSLYSAPEILRRSENMPSDKTDVYSYMMCAVRLFGGTLTYKDEQKDLFSPSKNRDLEQPVLGKNEEANKWKRTYRFPKEVAPDLEKLKEIIKLGANEDPNDRSDLSTLLGELKKLQAQPRLRKLFRELTRRGGQIEDSFDTTVQRLNRKDEFKKTHFLGRKFALVVLLGHLKDYLRNNEEGYLTEEKYREFSQRFKEVTKFNSETGVLFRHRGYSPLTLINKLTRPLSYILGCLILFHFRRTAVENTPWYAEMFRQHGFFPTRSVRLLMHNQRSLERVEKIALKS